MATVDEIAMVSLTCDFKIREIDQNDNAQLEQIIRQVLREYGADKPGFAWADPELKKMSAAYSDANLGYWVVELQGEVLGGCGIGYLDPKVDNVCELQKMYLLPQARGHGVGKRLLSTALKFAQQHHRWCYLETLKSMSSAAQLYRSFGFMALPKPLIETSHDGCDQWYLKELKHPKNEC